MMSLILVAERKDDILQVCKVMSTYLDGVDMIIHNTQDSSDYPSVFTYLLPYKYYKIVDWTNANPSIIQSVWLP